MIPIQPEVTTALEVLDTKPAAWRTTIAEIWKGNKVNADDKQLLSICR